MLVAIAAGGAALWFCLAAGDAGRSTRGVAAAGALEPSPDAGAQDALLVRPGATAGAADGAATDEGGRAPVRREEAPAAPVRPGKLTLSAVDAATGAPLNAGSLRLGSAKRFATADLAEHVELWLTPGVWDGSIACAGYEPGALQNVAIKSGEVTDAGQVVLSAGAGQIEGRVRAATGPVSVELAGVGRHPCLRCAIGEAEADEEPPACDPFARETPCPACGFAASRSILLVRPGESFSFRNLASGLYVARALDENGRALTREYQVAVRPRGSTWLELEGDSARDVECKLVFESGQPFEGVWQEDGEDRASAVELRFLRGGTEVAKATVLAQRRIELENGWVAMRSVSLGQGTFRIGRVVWGGSVLVLNEEVPEPTAGDRERMPEDTLWPDPVAADFEPTGTGASWCGAGTLRAGPLLCEGLSVRAECGPFASDTIRLDSACAGGTALLVMHPREQEDFSHVVILGDVPFGDPKSGDSPVQLRIQGLELQLGGAPAPEKE